MSNFTYINDIVEIFKLINKPAKPDYDFDKKSLILQQVGLAINF